MAKILQVCNTDFFLAKFIAPLVRRLVERGHQVECACEGAGVDPRSIGEGVVLHPFSFPREANVADFGRAIGAMTHLLRRGGYDCVDSHNRNASIVARAAAWLDGTPVRLYTAHGFYFHDDQPRVPRLATVALEAALAKITDFTFSQSREDAEFMVSQGVIEEERISVIGNGIDTKRFIPRPGQRRALEAELGLAPADFRVVSTGRLVKAKGFGDLLEAFAALEVKGKQLVIVGGNIRQDISPYMVEFTARVEALRLGDSVVVTGLTDKVERYLATSDVFVLASYREGLPRSLIEAMSVGLPVIATDIRGCREAIVDGETGFLFAPHDIASLAERLRRLAVGQEHREIGKHARERAVRYFGEDAYVEAQVVEIERLVGRVE